MIGSKILSVIEPVGFCQSFFSDTLTGDKKAVEHVVVAVGKAFVPSAVTRLRQHRLSQNVWLSGNPDRRATCDRFPASKSVLGMVVTFIEVHNTAEYNDGQICELCGSVEAGLTDV